MRWLAPLVLGALLAGCGAGGSAAAGIRAGVRDFVPPIGSTTIFDTAPGAAPDRRLILADLHLGPDATGAAHHHPWEEFLYILEGSAIVDLEGAAPRVLHAGESFVIPAGLVHTPRAGPHGVRAMVLRLHRQGDPFSIEAAP